MFENAAFGATLPASDIQRAIAWYSDVLGLEPVEVDPRMGATFKIGDAQFGVYPSAFAGTNQATAAGLRVADFDAAIAHLRSKGVTFEDVDFGEMGKTVDGVISDPEMGKAAWFKDSEGNILVISDR
jgi:catechol 2,3-dioxygenase-like lactoylglutathione lyase family enzyme